MWLYEGKEVDEVSSDFVGFVYIITNKITNRKYIGKKLLKFSKTKVKTVTLKNGTKKKKRIKEQIDSDWKDYYGSSKELLEDIEILGKDNFEREILFFCKSKAECSYIEAREQFINKVLESDDYYNNNIMCRIHGSHIKNKI